MVCGFACGFIDKSSKAQQFHHPAEKPPVMGSHPHSQLIDDYDPRRAEYVLQASPEEVDIAQADLLRKQVTSLRSAVQRRSTKLRSDKFNEAPHVVQHYELTMRKLSSTLRDARLGSSNMCSHSLLSPPITPVLSPLDFEEQWMEDDEMEEEQVGDTLVSDLDASETLHVEHPTKVEAALIKDADFVSHRAKGSIFDYLVYGCFLGLPKLIGF
jgi:hypothetical protein